MSRHSYTIRIGEAGYEWLDYMVRSYPTLTRADILRTCLRHCIDNPVSIEDDLERLTQERLT